MKSNKSFFLISGNLKDLVKSSYRIFLTGDRLLVNTLFVIALVMPGSILYGAEPSLKSSAVPEKVTVGQPVTYTLTISGFDPESLTITLPEKKVVFPDKKPDNKENKKENKNKKTEEKSSEDAVPLYIINSASRDDSKLNGSSLIDIKIMISYYRPGSYTLPEIKITGRDGVGIGYKIPAVTIDEINKEGKLEEIEPPVSLAGDHTRIIWVILAIVFISVAAFFFYRFLKNRKKYVAKEVPALPPIEIFLNDVETMKLRELIENGEINEYVFGISIVFRRYISQMLMFDAAEMTTDEISYKIKKHMPGDLYSEFGEEIISNMRLWDFSKFAEFAPSAELLLENLDATISTAKKISGMGSGENGTVRI